MSIIKSLVLPKIHEVYFEYDCNPMMHSRIADDGKVYLVYWFDYHHLVDFYAVVEVAPAKLVKFETNKVDIRSMFVGDDVGVVYTYVEFPFDTAEREVVAWEMLSSDLKDFRENQLADPGVYLTRDEENVEAC